MPTRMYELLPLIYRIRRKVSDLEGLLETVEGELEKINEELSELDRRVKKLRPRSHRPKRANKEGGV